MPICRALSDQGLAIAPRTYWARRKRPPSARALRDAMVTRLLAGIFEPGKKNGRPAPESLYGAVKAWGWLRRQGGAALRCGSQLAPCCRCPQGREDAGQAEHYGAGQADDQVDRGRGEGDVTLVWVNGNVASGPPKCTVAAEDCWQAAIVP